MEPAVIENPGLSRSIFIWMSGVFLLLTVACTGNGAGIPDLAFDTPPGDPAPGIPDVVENGLDEASRDDALDGPAEATHELTLAEDGANPDLIADTALDHPSDLESGDTNPDTGNPDPGLEETAIPAPPDPWEWGPYQVGTTSFNFFDWARLRLVATTVWYPANPLGQPKATYLVVIQGNAYSQASPDLGDAPYPLVLFSHGFRGTAVQSITFTEHLASHGFIVAAMDHAGNTLTDFFSDDEKVAQVALERRRAPPRPRKIRPR
ncbi:MAG: hypothetical protein ISR64_08635 [Deltaproteobacteria bacterium]|nr:hypothetical protein [Deltaproteobacteria bacterium]